MCVYVTAPCRSLSSSPASAPPASYVAAPSPLCILFHQVGGKRRKKEEKKGGKNVAKRRKLRFKTEETKLQFAKKTYSSSTRYQYL